MSVEDEEMPDVADQADGHQFALKTLAKARNNALNAITEMNALHNPWNNPFLPKGQGKSRHSQANSAVMTYHALLTKKPQLEEANVSNYYEEQFTTIPLPKQLLEDGEPVEIAVDDMQEPLNESLYKLELQPTPVSLESLEDWWDYPVQFKKTPGNVYERPYRDPEFEQLKIAAPPSALNKIFRRLDALAEQYGYLMKINQNDKNPYKI